MRSLPWLRLYTEARKDMKLAALNDSQFRLWFRLLCYAAEDEPRGVFEINPVTAVEVGVTQNTLVEELPVMVEVGLMTHEGDLYYFPAFSSRQYDGMHQTPDAWRERKRKQREKECDK